MCNMDSDETCVGYYKGGEAIREADIELHKLDPNSFGRVTRAGFQRIRVQVIHLNSYLADRRSACRTALRRAYERGAAHGVAIICGDFNGCAYRPSQGTQDNPNYLYPMCLEECQYVVDTINKNKPMSQRVGLLFRHSSSLAGTHYRPSLGSEQGLHGEDPDAPYSNDTMCVLVHLWPEIAQHKNHRAWYEKNTVKTVRAFEGQ